MDVEDKILKRNEAIKSIVKEILANLRTINKLLSDIKEKRKNQHKPL